MDRVFPSVYIKIQFNCALPAGCPTLTLQTSSRNFRSSIFISLLLGRGEILFYFIFLQHLPSINFYLFYLLSKFHYNKDLHSYRYQKYTSLSNSQLFEHYYDLHIDSFNNILSKTQYFPFGCIYRFSIQRQEIYILCINLLIRL